MEESSRPAVIVTMRDAERTIARTLSCLADQTVADFDVILVDDCSSSSSGLEIAHGFSECLNLTVVALDTNLGVAEAKNRGVRATQAELVAFLDSDDEVLPEWLESLTSALGDRDVVSCAYLVRELDEAGRLLRTRRMLAPCLSTDSWRQLLSGTFLVRRDLFLSVGGYDQAAEPMDNLDLSLSLARTGARHVTVDRELFIYNARKTGKAKRDDYAQKSALNIRYFLDKHRWYYQSRRKEVARSLEVAATGAARTGLGRDAGLLILRAFWTRPNPKIGLKMLLFTLATPLGAGVARWRERKHINRMIDA
ncbi:MAG: glycosyltransferase family 2 protein [Chloroflexi bacterium]|nr:glycosyltransferase family 2 protein [Chloroflexota bacterium]